MATPHLSYAVTDGNHLLRDNGNRHLVTVRCTSALSNVTMVIPPEHEWYVAGAASADVTSWDLFGSDAAAVSDASAVAEKLSSAFSALDQDGWTEGHKAVFSYNSRFGCQYYAKTHPTYTGDQLGKRFEIGASRNLFRFYTRGFPTGNCSSFAAYLRLHNPSNVFVRPEYPRQGYGWAKRHNYGGRLRYVIGDTALSPSSIDSAAAGTCHVPSIANEGNVSSTGDGTGCFVAVYDAWDGFLTAAKSKSGLEYTSAIVYRGTRNTTNTLPSYYYDHQITGVQLENLKTQNRENGRIWVALGFPAVQTLYGPDEGYAASGALYAGASDMTYVSRVELVIKATLAKFNN